jgi:transcriptional regulator with XRE-family HTH domain
MSFRRVNGPSVRAVREALGIRLTELALRSDISVGYLSNIEAGRKQPTDAVAAAIARGLGVSIDSITYPVELVKATA